MTQKLNDILSCEKEKFDIEAKRNRHLGIGIGMQIR